jgi:hypothetical protein
VTDLNSLRGLADAPVRSQGPRRTHRFCSL